MEIILENSKPWMEISEYSARGEEALRMAKEYIVEKIKFTLEVNGVEEKKISELLKELSESDEVMMNLKYWENDGTKRIIVLKRSDIFS